MVAKITTGKDVYGALAYNQQKVDRGKGKVLLTHILREPSDGRFDVVSTAEDLLRWMPSHYRTEKPVVHISLNPDPEDRLTAEQLTEIAEKYMERMGWGEQPYIVFEHTDIDRQHIHIVSVQVGQDGRKVKDSRRNERSVAVTEELEREYGLHPAKERKRAEDWRLTAVDSTKGDLKRQIGAVVKPAVAMYRFQMLGVGFDELERHMERSRERIKRDDTRKRLCRLVDEALRTAATEHALRDSLRKERIDLYLRRNDTGRIVGVTFIDHETRCVVNGSRLGKAYSANAFEQRFGNRQNSDTDMQARRREPSNEQPDMRNSRNTRGRKL